MLSQFLISTYKSKVKWIKFKRLLSIPRGEKVLDIGGGDGPFARADIVCEKFIGDNTERARVFLKDRPLVLGDIEDLPFKDKSFDFVYCSHILEHVHNPKKAIEEIQRVGKRGFVEVPSEYLELTATSTPSHLWTIRLNDLGELVFKPKDSASLNPQVDAVFRRYLWMNDPTYMAFHWKNYYRLFNIGLNWEKTIPFRVETSSSPIQQKSFTKGQVESREGIQRALNNPKSHKKFSVRRLIKNIIEGFYRDKSIYTWLLSHIACPKCKSALSKGEGHLVCSTCQSSYPLVGDVPLLLKEHAKQGIN
ncbi:MAG: methyltransferase domain-containing protein [Elusimicrobia bacterium]|nr:methyltransferase domain-containing protein [Candidatus Obscuribacterium magneticum]